MLYVIQSNISGSYGSRLPEKCVSIQKKCGAGTPIAGNSSRPPARRHKKQPGLEKPPALSRSITAPASTTATASRAGFATATEKLSIPKNPWKSVDINAVATKKLQKRAVAIPALNKPTANVDEELKDAIKTLTKPNRAALGAEFMEGATRRLGGERGSIKSKHNRP